MVYSFMNLILEKFLKMLSLMLIMLFNTRSFSQENIIPQIIINKISRNISNDRVRDKEVQTVNYPTIAGERVAFFLKVDLLMKLLF